MTSLGAGWQCGYPNFCPAFVLCLAFVQHASRICLHFVLVKHLSNICPKNPTFVPSKSNICPSNQTFVLDLSSDFVKIHQKLEGQNLVISRTCQFSHLESGHTPLIGCASVTVGAGVKDTISWKMWFENGPYPLWVQRPDQGLRLFYSLVYGYSYFKSNNSAGFWFNGVVNLRQWCKFCDNDADLIMIFGIFWDISQNGDLNQLQCLWIPTLMSLVWPNSKEFTVLMTDFLFHPILLQLTRRA